MSARLFCLRGFRVVTSPIQSSILDRADEHRTDPHQNVIQFLRSIKLARAKHYLKRRGIKQWDRWDYSNKAFAWKK